MIKAVTFDLWDTMVHDDSDEPKRAARGLATKKETRRELLWGALNERAPIARAHVWLAYDVADAAFNHVWHDQHVTWTIEERLSVILRGLGRSLPGDAFDTIVESHATMEVDIPPDPIDGIGEALARLGERYRLAVVSDAIVSPGRCLRELLEVHGLLKHFSAFAFSDEVGHSKPHPAMFETVRAELGVPLEAIVHIGDRDHNDVKGPQALGMKAVLFTASRDTDRDRTTADAVCDSHRDLPAVIDRLAGMPD